MCQGNELLAVETAFGVARQDAFKLRGPTEPEDEGIIREFD
jgi:hypothetical protein